MTVFKLPDLGEGLPDAEIVEWLVAEGDEIQLDQPLVSMETAKAVVEVPSPVTGKVLKFHGQAGDVIQTGAPLVEFWVEGDDEQPSAEELPDLGGEAEPSYEAALGAEDSEPSSSAISLEDLDLQPPEEHNDSPEDLYDEFGAGDLDQVEDTDPSDEDWSDDEPDADEAQESQAPAPDSEPAPESPASEDSGTVVGNVQAGNVVLHEQTTDFGGIKATPAVRALARKLRVEIRNVQPSGSDNVVTAADVRQAAADGSAPLGASTSPSPASADAPVAPSTPDQAKADGADEWTPVRGTRRTMARVMSESHRSIVPTTLMDDADIHAWSAGEDITARLIRSLWSGAKAEPGLNAWYDGENGMRMIHKNMHVGMAVDTADGLFVAALRNINRLDRGQLRQEIDRLRENATNRSIPPEDLKDYTIILSNFGKFAGRYATPVITPPCVSIVAAGALRHEVVPVLGGIEVHRMIPLSLTFDHRACTGGEAARFLKAMLDDLARPH
ncbi:MAG: 2-oxo acid dehydrogenase subunit E2 [Wenzhouxiangella sp.]|jgi:pyruvate dehydrogenase E2 component (dihydrolipoamide acetyltransferase)|nr:2-oxo acid dehydrogenase subunit E2 [Wenzhouxiangella sp.]